MNELSKIAKLLKTNFEDLESFIDLLPIGIYITMPDGQFTLINKHIVKIFGFDSKKEFFDTFKNGYNAYADARTRDLFIEILKNEGKVNDLLIEYKTQSDRVLIANENAIAIIEDNVIKYIVGTIEDITEETREQKEKVETTYFISSLNEALLELIKNKTPNESVYDVFDVIGRHLGIVSIYSFVTRFEGDEIFSESEITWVNETLIAHHSKLENRKINFFKVTPSIAKRVSTGKYFCTTDCEITDFERKVLDKFNIKSLLATPAIFEENFIGFILYVDTIENRVWKDYEIKLLNFLANSIGSYYVNFAKEEEIKSLNSKLETVVDAASLGTWEWDLSSGYVSVNTNFLSYTGLNSISGKVKSGDIISLMSETDKQIFQEFIYQIQSNKTRDFVFDFKLNKENKWLNAIGKVVKFNRNGKPAIISGILIDISKQVLFEKQLMLNNEKIQSIINNSHLIFCEIDTMGIIKEIHGNLLEDYGFNSSLINTHIDELPESLDNLKQCFIAVNKETVRNTILLDDMVLECKSRVIVSDENNVETMFYVITDQTLEHKYLSDIVKTNQRLYAVINSIPGPVNIISTNLEIIDSNQWLLLGWEPGIPNKIVTLEDIRFDENQNTFYDLRSINLSKKSGKPTVRLTTDYEDEVLGLSLLLITQPILDENDNVWSYVQLGLDVSELRLSQKLMREAIKTKDRFFDIIAHDLRNPINALSSLLDDLLGNYTKFSLNDIYNSNLQIQESIMMLSQLLNNLLDWARSQTGRINNNPDFIDASYIARNVTEINSDIARIKNITIDNKIEYGTVVYVDSNMFYTILRNLVSNSMKYSNQNGKITIQAATSDDFTVFSVSDSGVGISKDRVDKLFKLEFVQSTKGTNQEKGTGLGLILCKEFVEKNNGKIWVESIENEGTTFYFTVPRNPKNNPEDN